MISSLVTKWHTSSDSMKLYKANIDRKMLECQALLSRAILKTV